MEIGIIGLPNVGKSTIFNALTAAGAEAENYPFCTIDPNVGIVEVPDERLDKLYELYQPETKTPATIKFVDIAGLVSGASQGEGLGNQFLAQIREVDAVAHVVRCFQDSDVSHVSGDIAPIRDIETIDTELALADLETVGRRREKTSRMLKSGDKKYKQELEALEYIEQILESGESLRQLRAGDELSRELIELIEELELLSAKPVLYIANVDEGDLAKADNQAVAAIREYAAREGAEVVRVSAAIESDIAELDPDEARLFLEELGLEESGLKRVIKAGYSLLGLITFFTVAGGNEVRASTIRRGATAPEAAGRIHSDMQQGFIRAEVISFEELIQAGSIARARDRGLVRLEGKDYVVKDGDVCYFRFNV